MVVTALLIAAQISVSDTLWTETTDGYLINVNYPVVALDDTAIGSRLEEYAMGYVESFRENFSTSYNPEWNMDWELQINFTHEPSPQDMICILCWIWEYSGGAHGNAWSQDFNYNTETGMFLGPVELVGGEEQFEAFSQKVMDELYAMLGEEDWIQRGASADPQNYHSVLPVPDEYGRVTGYTVIFPPYQVACYAAGTIEVYIPLD